MAQLILDTDSNTLVNAIAVAAVNPIAIAAAYCQQHILCICHRSQLLQLSLSALLPKPLPSEVVANKRSRPCQSVNLGLSRQIC